MTTAPDIFARPIDIFEKVEAVRAAGEEYCQAMLAGRTETPASIAGGATGPQRSLVRQCPWTADEVEAAKLRVLEAMTRGDGRSAMVGVVRACAIAGVELGYHGLWLKSDPDYRYVITLHEEWHTHAMAESLLSIHDLFGDAKMATMASANIKWYVARKNAKDYGDGGKEDKDTSALVDVLREAIARIPRPAESRSLTILSGDETKA